MNRSIYFSALFLIAIILQFENADADCVTSAAGVSYCNVIGSKNGYERARAYQDSVAANIRLSGQLKDLSRRGGDDQSTFEVNSGHSPISLVTYKKLVSENSQLKRENNELLAILGKVVANQISSKDLTQSLASVLENRKQMEDLEFRGIITKGHFLESPNCGSLAGVGEGAIVKILDPKPVRMGHYNEAIRVRVISNTVYEYQLATVGCEGYVLERLVKQF